MCQRERTAQLDLPVRDLARVVLDVHEESRVGIHPFEPGHLSFQRNGLVGLFREEMMAEHRRRERQCATCDNDNEELGFHRLSSLRDPVLPGSNAGTSSKRCSIEEILEGSRGLDMWVFYLGLCGGSRAIFHAVGEKPAWRPIAQSILIAVRRHAHE